MMDEKISIIIPVYNAEKSLENTLNSVCNQTYKNLEIIIVNDGSQDNSLNICKKFKDNDLRIILIDKNNEGVSAARNDAITISSGKYLVFVDADDYMQHNAIERLMNYHTTTGAEYICASYKILKTRNRYIYKKYTDKYFNTEDIDNNIEYLTNEIAFAPWGKLFCASIIKDNKIFFQEKLPYGEDAVFHYNYLKHIKSLYLTSDILYNYNFTDYSSAVNKYYNNYYLYLFEIYSAKAEVLILKSNNNNKINNIENDKIVFFERCLEHYILNEKKINKLISYINNSANQFDINIGHGAYGSLVKNSKWKTLIFKWLLKNYKTYIKRKILSVIS